MVYRNNSLKEEAKKEGKKERKKKEGEEERKKGREEKFLKNKGNFLSYQSTK